jgi:medium-chain acyl-[acyl-carrier-protein] hydrolase
MIKPIWQENIKISTFDVGASGHMEAVAAMRYFQEVAAHHATNLKVGFEHFQKENIFWVLTHLQIEATRWPEMQEPVTFETWPREIQKLFTTRDYLVKDKDGNVLIKGTSAWIIVDMNRKRPVRPADRLAHVTFLPEKISLANFPDEIIIPESKSSYKKARPVVYSDLDINQHVNNTRYVEWIMDALAPEATKKLSSLNIHFTREFKRNQTATLNITHPKNNNSEAYVSIDHSNSGKNGCVAYLKFE